MAKIVITNKPVKQKVHRITISLKRLHLYIDYDSDRDWILIGVEILEKWKSKLVDLNFLTFIRINVSKWQLRVGLYGGESKSHVFNNRFEIEW
jgi:hypothetical protein